MDMGASLSRSAPTSSTVRSPRRVGHQAPIRQSHCHGLAGAGPPLADGPATDPSWKDLTVLAGADRDSDAPISIDGFKLE